MEEEGVRKKRGERERGEREREEREMEREEREGGGERVEREGEYTHYVHSTKSLAFGMFTHT